MASDLEVVLPQPAELALGFPGVLGPDRSRRSPGRAGSATARRGGVEAWWAVGLATVLLPPVGLVGWAVLRRDTRSRATTDPDEAN